MTGDTRRRMSRSDRERQILDAAVTVFSSRGYAGASMDAVAERVGVTKPVLYTHFGSKEGLLLACIARARAELLDATATATASATTPEEMLRRGTRAFFDYLDAHAPAWTLLYAESGATHPAAEAIEEVRAQQTDFLAGLLAAVDPDAGRAHLAGWAQVIVGACERLAVWRAQVDESERLSTAQATECLMDLAWTGLAARRR